MPNLWPMRWPVWLNISRIVGMLAALIAVAWAGRKWTQARERSADHRLMKTQAEAQATLAKAGVEKAVYQAEVVRHGEEAMKHEVMAADYEARIVAAKARLARLRSGQ